MKRALVSVIAIGLPFALACSSSSTNGNAEKEGGAGTASSTSSGSSGGSTSSASSGATTSSSGGDDASDGVGVDCTTAPCTTKGLVCCPAVNVCTPPNMMDCASPVWVACTKTPDCETGQVCCVTPATTTGSGPSGSACRTACLTANNDAGTPPDQGPACNFNDGVIDCPAPASQWVQCVQVSNSPAGLGLCVAKVPTGDGGAEEGGVEDAGGKSDGGKKDGG
jgi:hypothetical protein